VPMLTPKPTSRCRADPTATIAAACDL